MEISEVITHQHGNMVWKNEKGETHRLDGPAHVANDFTEYYVFGKRHRIDGPAQTNKYGSYDYWINDKRHRDDGPASYSAKSEKNTVESYYWWLNGELHRRDGPAIDHGDRQYFYFCGQAHNLKGACSIEKGIENEWAIFGQYLTKSSFDELVNHEPTLRFLESLEYKIERENKREIKEESEYIERKIESYRRYMKEQMEKKSWHNNLPPY